MSLSFMAQQGSGNPAAQTLTISNTGGGTLSWNANESTTWLSLSPASGTGNVGMTASVATGFLTAGTCNGVVTLSATVTAAPTINLNPLSLSYAATQGAATPVNQNISLTNTSGILNWRVSDNASWLAVIPASGSGSSTLTTSMNTAGLTAQTYTGTLTVSPAGASSKTVAATLLWSQPPMTYLETKVPIRMKPARAFSKFFYSYVALALCQAAASIAKGDVILGNFSMGTFSPPAAEPCGRNQH